MIRADIANFKTALGNTGIAEGFMTAVAPASCARIENKYYKSDEEFLFACAEAMREEYKAIVDAGLVLQIDDPSLPDNWDMISPEPPLAEFKKFERVRMEMPAVGVAEGGASRQGEQNGRTRQAVLSPPATKYPFAKP